MLSEMLSSINNYSERLTDSIRTYIIINICICICILEYISNLIISFFISKSK